MNVRRAVGAVAAAVLLSLSLLAAGAAQDEPITPLAFVTVGDPNNPPDPVTHTGALAYVFDIGKYEVTNAQYCEFLNAVAAEADPHNLYSVNMERGLMGGIRRIQKDSRYAYEVIEGYTNLPVNYVSWYDSVRFCNWLHYGKPTTARSEMGTTEGDDKAGAYDTREIDANPRGAQRIVIHNSGAKFWVPSLDEWNKAAYYDPTKEGKGGYWLYPTQSDTKPAAVPPGNTPNAANYYDFKWAAPQPHLTPVGAYAKSPSHYGTFDQAGNLWEWVETLRADYKQRWVRGGAATTHANTLVRTNTDSEFGDHELYCFGFRVCRKP